MSCSCVFGKGALAWVWVFWHLRLRAPPEFHQVVHAHYDVYKHSQSGLIFSQLWQSQTWENHHGNILKVTGIIISLDQSLQELHWTSSPWTFGSQAPVPERMHLSTKARRCSGRSWKWLKLSAFCMWNGWPRTVSFQVLVKTQTPWCFVCQVKLAFLDVSWSFLIAPRSAALQDFCKRASKTATSRVKETSLKKCVNPYLKSQFQSERDPTQSQVHTLPEAEPTWWNWSPATLWRGVFVAVAAQSNTMTSSSRRGLLDAFSWILGDLSENPSVSRGWTWLAPNTNVNLWLVFGKTRRFIGIGLGWRQMQMSICDWFLGKPVAF